MKKSLTNKIFIYAFLFLYALVAFISFCHAIEFFDIGNTHWMSVMLAFAFELGLAVCLASILIGTNKRNNIAWVLLTILVLVQVIGNTYSVFKYISESGYDYYNYLAKPMLFMIEEVSQETVQVIISWIMGAILPIVALLMTEMVANGIKEEQMIEDKPEEKTEEIDHQEENHPKIIPPVIPQPEPLETKYEDEKEESNEDENNESDEPEVIVNDVDDDPEEQISIDEKPEEPVETQENVEDVTPFEQKSVIEPEETTVKDEETQVSVEPVIAQTPVEVNEDTSNKEYGLSNENHKKFVAIDKEPKTMFDELQKESLN
jgi:hypothetical protein